jgi:hypothetical protein
MINVNHILSKMSNKYRKISTIFLNKVKSDVKIQFTKIPTYYRKVYENQMIRYRSASSYEKKMITASYGGVIGTFIGFTCGSYLRYVIDRKRIEYCDYFYLMCIGGVGGSFVGLTYQLIPVYIGLYAIDRTFKIYGKIKRC